MKIPTPLQGRCPGRAAVLGLIGLGMASIAPGQHIEVSSLTRIDTGDSLFSDAWAINDAGQIAGNFIPAPFVNAGFFTDGFTVTNLNTLLGSTQAEVGAMNSSGLTVGRHFPPDPLRSSVFRFENGTAVDIAGFAGAHAAHDVNDSGTIVGQAQGSFTRPDGDEAFAIVNGSIVGLGFLDPASNTSAARSINNAGVIVGESGVQSLGPGSGIFQNAFRFENGVMTNIHALVGGTAGQSSGANAINSHGQIVGTVGSSGFLLDAGEVTPIGTPEASFTPIRINDGGVVIGGYQSAETSFQDRPFLFLEGEIFDINTLVQPLLSDGSASGFLELTAARDINNLDQIVGQGRFRDDLGNISTQAFRLDLQTTQFIWDGKEGFAFGDAGNWSDGVAPGPRNTVRLTDTQAKTIEFESGVLTENARLIVEGDSETDIDLNGGTWRIDPGTGAPAADGQFRMAGATLTVTDGTLEVFGAAVLLNDGATSALLQLGNGGKFAVRGDDFITGRGVGGKPAFLGIDGLGSLLEARAIVLGEESGQFTGLVSAGGRMVASHSVIVGGSAPAAIAFTGASDPADPLNTGSRLTINEGGTLDVGLNAEGSLSVSNGAIAELTNVTVTIGANEASGRFSASGSTLVAGGRFSVGENGLLEVKEAQVHGQRLEAEGGVIDIQSGGHMLTDESMSLFGDTLLTADGGSLVRSPTLFTASSRIHITGNSTLHVPGEEGTTLFPLDGTKSARMLGGTLLIEQGSVFETPVFALQAGTVLGRGTIRGTVINTGGTFLPGQSPGILTIDGDYIQTGGRIVLEIGGLLGGTQYDQLVVTGTFDLTGGEIEFAFIDGFAPQAGQTFAFFDIGGSFTGTPEFVVSGLEDGWEFDTAFDPETGGFSMTSLNDAVAVPEPATLALLVAAVGALALARKSRRRPAILALE